MAWKQDLAKLKQQLGPEAPAAPPKPIPKPKPVGPVVLDDEDAVFLSAMGLKAAPPRPTKAPAPQDSPAPARAAEAPPQTPESFQDAIKDLKGLKPLSRGLPAQPAPVPPPAPLPEALPKPVLVPPVPGPPPMVIEPEPPVQPLAPLRFQLAAGMAIEVDGALDLRGHSLSDAMERLKDRLGDGLLLGWRCIQVILGPDPTLHEGLLALLASGQAPMVARYAQAPIPMGGTQAWLLYFAHLPAPSGFPRLEL